MLYLWIHFDDPMAHFKSHRPWNRLPPNPLNLVRTLELIVSEAPSAGVSLLLFTVLGLRAWWKRGPFFGTMILVPLMQASFTGTPISLERIVLASFLAFLDLGELLRRSIAFWTVLIFFVVVQCLALNRHVHFIFVA